MLNWCLPDCIISGFNYALNTDVIMLLSLPVTPVYALAHKEQQVGMFSAT